MAGAPVSVLPPQAGPFEKALDLAIADRLAAIDPRIILEVVDPYRIPIELLPWLAWQLKVDIWSDEWPEARKRWVVATEIDRKREKGTLAGIRAYLGLVDTDLIDAIVPPAKTFLSPSYSAAERAAYLARFPQLRVYPYVANATKRFAHFTSAAYALPKAFLGAGYPMIVGADHRYTRTAVLWDRGLSTNLTLRTIQPEQLGSIAALRYDEVILPAVPSSEIFPGGPPKARYFFGMPYDPQRLVRVPVTEVFSFTEARETFTTISPGLGLIEVDPTDVAISHPAQKGALFPGAGYLGSPIARSVFLPPSAAWRNIYQLWYLFDPKRVPESRRRWTHLGACRLGMPAYNAELKVKINGHIGPREFWRYCRGFLRDPGRTPEQIDDARMGVRVAMSARDKILLRTKTKTPFTTSDHRKVGAIRVGELIDVLA